MGNQSKAAELEELGNGWQPYDEMDEANDPPDEDDDFEGCEHGVGFDEDCEDCEDDPIAAEMLESTAPPETDTQKGE